MAFLSTSLSLDRFDRFKTIFGVLIIIGSFYLFLVILPKYSISPLFSLAGIVLFVGLVINGFYLLVSGYSDMDYDYNLDINLKEIDSLSKLSDYTKNKKLKSLSEDVDKQLVKKIEEFIKSLKDRE